MNHWFVLVLGVWVLLAPWILGFSDFSLAKWGNVVAGVAFVLLSVWQIFGGNREQ